MLIFFNFLNTQLHCVEFIERFIKICKRFQNKNVNITIQNHLQATSNNQTTKFSLIFFIENCTTIIHKVSYISHIHVMCKVNTFLCAWLFPVFKCIHHSTILRPLQTCWISWLYSKLTTFSTVFKSHVICLWENCFRIPIHGKQLVYLTHRKFQTKLTDIFMNLITLIHIIIPHVVIVVTTHNIPTQRLKQHIKKQHYMYMNPTGLTISFVLTSLPIHSSFSNKIVFAVLLVSNFSSSLPFTSYRWILLTERVLFNTLSKTTSYSV